MQTKFFICFALYAVYVDSEPTSYVGQTGKGIKLMCPGKGEVSWKRNGANIITVDKTGRKSIGNLAVAARSSVYGTDLAISNLQPEDTGTFICVITGRNGQTTSHHNLFVFTVSVSVDPGSPLLASTAAALTCKASGSPKEVKWKYNDKTYDEKIVRLKSVSTSDAGKWTCLVSYADGKLEDSLNIDVIDLKKHDNVSVKPEQKVDLPCTLIKSNFGSLDVVRGGWKHLSSTSADASWLPSLDTSNTKELRWNGGPSKKVTFSKEKLDTNFGITLLKVKAEQEGKYQCYIEFKDRGTLTADVFLDVVLPDRPNEAHQGKSPPSLLGLNMWIWVGVGAGSVVIIALMVAIVLVHRSNRRKKMRMRKLKSVRKPLTPNDYCQCNCQPRGDNMDRAARVPRQQRIPENIQINGGHGRRSCM